MQRLLHKACLISIVVSLYPTKRRKMLIKTRGIVLKTIKYGETSIIADVYTEEKGLRKYIINGVRTKKARFHASLFQVMSLLDLVAYHREDRDLNHIKEIQSAYVYHSLPFEIGKSGLALFMAEIIRKTVRESEENRPLFEFLYDNFVFLDETTQPVRNVHLHFLIELSAFLGFMPSGEFSLDTPFFDLQEGMFVADISNHAHYLDEQLSAVLQDLLNHPIAQCHDVEMTGSQRRTLLKYLLDYYKLHMDFMPDINSHEVLHEVLND